MTRLLIADDHPIIRQGLRQILEDEPDMEVVVEAGDGDEAFQIAAANDVDVVILDVSMPGKNWLDVIRESRIRKPQLIFLVLSRHADVQYALTALNAGAAGYLTKNNVVGELIGAIRKVSSGENYVSPDLAGKLARDMASGVSAGRLPHELLSPNEFKVLCLIIKGSSLKEIAGELNLAQSTISTYKSRIMRKMNMSMDADLIRYGLQHDLN
jgi:two-component system, NarL family, invasion response regulator UvrY